MGTRLGLCTVLSTKTVPQKKREEMRRREYTEESGIALNVVHLHIKQQAERRRRADCWNVQPDALGDILCHFSTTPANAMTNTFCRASLEQRGLAEMESNPPPH